MSEVTVENILEVVRKYNMTKLPLNENKIETEKSDEKSIDLEKELEDKND